MKEFIKMLTECMNEQIKKETNTLKKSNRRKTHEQYVEEVKNKNPNVTVLEKYIDAKTKILHKCNICGKEWEVTPNSILNGKGCPNCNIKKLRSPKKTHEKFIEEMFNINKDITVIGKYNGARNPIECKCNKCNYIWNPTASSILSGSGCPKCAGRNKTTEEFIKEMDTINSDIEILGEYINSITPIKCKCRICKHEWYTKPTNLLHNKNGCPICGIEKSASAKRMSQEEFEKRLNETHNNEIIALEEYKGFDVRIKFKHIKCGYIWKTSPHSVISNNTGCPKCNISNGENFIVKYLKNNKIMFISQKKYKNLLGIGGKQLSYDFYLPKYNLLIEFQGGQHEQPVEYFGGKEQFKVQQEHDKRKREYAKLHNINLLEIWYYDINNIEKILTETLNNLKLETVETTGIA